MLQRAALVNLDYQIPFLIGEEPDQKIWDFCKAVDIAHPGFVERCDT